MPMQPAQTQALETLSKCERNPALSDCKPQLQQVKQAFQTAIQTNPKAAENVFNQIKQLEKANATQAKTILEKIQSSLQVRGQQQGTEARGERTSQDRSERNPSFGNPTRGQNPQGGYGNPRDNQNPQNRGNKGRTQDR